MGLENNARAFGDFVQFFHENGAGAAQLIYHVPVMDDLFAHVDRRSIEVERDLHYVDCAYYSSAEPTRFQQDNLLLVAVQAHKNSLSITNTYVFKLILTRHVRHVERILITS